MDAAHVMHGRKIARFYSQVSWRAEWRRNRRTQQVKCWVSFTGQSHVFSRASHGPLAFFTSCSSRIASQLRSSSTTFHFLSRMRYYFLFPPFFLSAGRRVIRPKSRISDWHTQQTHNLAWMALPGTRHAGKGLHHRVQSVCFRESVCARWKSSSRSSVNRQKPVDWISGWAGSVETPSLPERTTQKY